MSILSNVNQQLNKMSSQAKKAYDLAKIDSRIKSYAKEEQEIYKKLGKAVYSNYRYMLKDEDLRNACDSVDAIRGRLKDLDKQKANINHKEGSADAQQSFAKSQHQMLDKKESDLTFTRTSEGVKIIRICPQCQHSNAPEDAACENCGYEIDL